MWILNSDKQGPTMPHPTTTAQSRCDKVLTKPSESATWHRDDDHTWIALDSCVFSKNCLADATLSDSFMAFFHLPGRRRVHQSWWNPLEVWRKQVKIIEPKYGPSSKPIIVEDSQKNGLDHVHKLWFSLKVEASLLESYRGRQVPLILVETGQYLCYVCLLLDIFCDGLCGKRTSGFQVLHLKSKWHITMISMGQKLGTWMKIA